MTFANLKKHVGTKTNIIDSSDNFVDGLVTEADVERYLNTHYKNVSNRFMEQYPDHFVVLADVDLVADQGRYSLEGDATDAINVLYVGVKYSSGDNHYTRCIRKRYKDLHTHNTSEEGFGSSNPFYYMTSIKDAATGNLIRAIGLVPVPSDVVSEGLRIRYTEEPSDMSSDTDTPYPIPSPHHIIVALHAVADVWEQKGDWAKSERAKNRAMWREEKFFEGYIPAASDRPTTWTPDITFSPRNRSRATTNI